MLFIYITPGGKPGYLQTPRRQFEADLQGYDLDIIKLFRIIDTS